MGVKIKFKERKRYLIFRIITKDELVEISAKHIVKAVSDRLIKLFGEVGASKTHFWLHYYDNKEKIGLIECRLKSLRILRAALASITKINTHKILFYTMGVTGTIKSAKRKFQINF
ncbi:MAG: Rpp14/Pop5 family protein [Candidatus Odinarchaeia archaeon]